MKTIWKYELPQGVTTISIPKDAEVLSVASQNNNVCMWAKVDPAEPLIDRVFYVFGTGHEIKSDFGLKFIGTTLLFNEELVYHVFEKIKMWNYE